ncbi:MAG: hypothetical protein SCM96_07215 [Acidobacteriota bacterium]|nr:hypothetical protein [Acidobacteriota bacterium]
MKHPRKHIICDSIQELKPILKKWCDLNREYTEKTKSDCSWWYGERAAISILAAAVWKSGNIALEEYSTDKRGDEFSASVKGRCDLKIVIGDKKFLFEAKQIRPRLSKKKEYDALSKPCEGILNKLISACRGAGRLKSREGMRFGICFVSPRISESEADHLGERIDKLINLLLEKSRKYHAIAWYFANNWDDLKEKKNIYPGVILLIREVKKFKPKKSGQSRRSRKSRVLR